MMNFDPFGPLRVNPEALEGLSFELRNQNSKLLLLGQGAV